jgi:hypothetical protein
VRRAILTLTLATALGGCGHVTVQTNDPSARIYADGVFMGRGEAKVAKRTGPPKSMLVEVKVPGTTVKRELKREFTTSTLLLGMVSYMTGFLWGWQYPENVMVLLPSRPGGGWDEEPSPWDEPRGGGAGWDEGKAPAK